MCIRKFNIIFGRWWLSAAHPPPLLSSSQPFLNITRRAPKPWKHQRKIEWNSKLFLWVFLSWVEGCGCCSTTERRFKENIVNKTTRFPWFIFIRILLSCWSIFSVVFKVSFFFSFLNYLLVTALIYWKFKFRLLLSAVRFVTFRRHLQKPLRNTAFSA